MSLLLAIFLGVVQGVAEFLPISSSGHLSALQNLLGVPAADDSHLLLDVMLHLGTLISICVSLQRELRAIISETSTLLRGDETRAAAPPNVRTLILIAIATLPMLAAIPFYGLIRRLFFNTAFIGFMLLLTGALLFVSSKYLKPGAKTERTLTIPDALMIGLSQVVSLIPGLSRLGATVSVGLSRGAERGFAVKFSLLLSIPAVLGSAVVTLAAAVKNGIDWSVFPMYLAGLLVAAVVGILAIQLLRAAARRADWSPFAYYCFGAGAFVLLLSIIF
ncbi:MAG: undecaprenyl-diphosphate phosphatase [Oscillospiraceae bacterium]|jgi:undecaprenyl-diphosphatase|nr:undecaprenyl-diphosphate phosphatase [Oscillospiraceae bacterium]